MDQLLHSAAHLFLDAEPRDRVRDLVDLDGLFRHFGTLPGFWDELPRRAESLGLSEPLALACHFTQRWLGTALPSALTELAGLERAGARPPRWRVAAFVTVLQPTEPGAMDGLAKRLAATALLARYHWHRMPLGTLLPHLWRKSSQRTQL
jgi:hypothetical protein